MTQEFFFKHAKWIGDPVRTPKTFSVLRGHFCGDGVRRAMLNVLGLGFFKCYINGHCINPDTFLPLSSDYEPGCDPKEELLSGHRIYVPQFDITAFLQPGDNVIAIQYGGGWYTCKLRSLILKSCCEVFALQRLFSGKACGKGNKLTKISLWTIMMPIYPWQGGDCCALQCFFENQDRGVNYEDRNLY